ncbi:3',5'-cyclic AMP phosphodiesterase CpdA [Amycolatopsis bartoniae]|uniref:Metallophosphoesterase n=1 Tax=Amycolatopsis bartoniae TaxID=941986 RepID=A0A8H9IX43_9PSEU|nr:metallophosphoesterase [Amycolatopsis bartoniae]MBB2936975.1 3',5'-cyclic AMP phosphodiesterase CpdA [Amycolatopsis bartoniae]TVT06442.1 metallophosphoesterase [Amycolatopsis bartoniae]GHF51568.1 metallophosphoesterase [Amycolatopsis bartoniae]
MPSLYATSDLHVTHRGNEPLVDDVRGDSPDDWLLVAGDVAEKVGAVVDTLATLRERFAKVVWVPGNHELWTTPQDDVPLRGEERYRHLVDRCRGLDVLTPEDEFPVWEHGERLLTVAPLFVLYDYSWRTPQAEDVSLDEALDQAREAGVVCTDEYFLHPDPHPSRHEWCARRLKVSEERLAAIPEDHGTVLMSHWPLHRHPTAPLYWPEFALWCGTTRTEDWHVRYRAEVAVFGHLHIPRTTWADGVRFEEVSLGYPREWRKRARGPVPVRKIL